MYFSSLILEHQYNLLALFSMSCGRYMNLTSMHKEDTVTEKGPLTETQQSDGFSRSSATL